MQLSVSGVRVNPVRPVSYLLCLCATPSLSSIVNPDTLYPPRFQVVPADYLKTMCIYIDSYI